MNKFIISTLAALTFTASMAAANTSTWHGSIEHRVIDFADNTGRLIDAKSEVRLRVGEKSFILTDFAAADRSARIASAEPLAASSGSAAVTGTLQSDGSIAVSSLRYTGEASQQPRNIVSKPITIILSLKEENDTNLDKIKKTMAQVAETFKVTSYGHKKLDLDANGDGEPDVYGAVKVDGDSSSCRYTDWGEQALKIVQEKHNIDLSLYNHRTYIFDENYSCRWAGIAAMGCLREQGGSDCSSWMNTHAPGVILHELGHNLGMHHSMKGGQEYGDMSDPMGSGMETFFNGAHTDQLGWFKGFDSAILDIESLDGKSTTVEIHPMTSDNEGKLKAIRYNYKKIPFGGVEGGADDSYYFGLRTEEGLDAKIAKSRDKTTKYLDHLNVHTIFSEAGGGKTKFITSIGDGETWSHPEGAFKLTQQPAEASKAKKILIEFN